MSIAAINGFRNTFCLAIRSEEEGRLTVVIAEAAPDVRPDPPVPRRFTGVVERQPVEPPVTYVLEWEWFTAFQVRNESYAIGDATAITAMAGRTLQEFSRSRYLEFVRANTSSAEQLQAGPLRHWEISTWSGIVDVASTKAPTIREERTAHAA